jgi:hypothetical protein
MNDLAVKQTRAGEHGAISIKALLLLVLVGATAFLVLKLAPVYIEQTRVIHDVNESARIATVRSWKEDKISQELKRIRGEYELPEGSLNFVNREKGVQISVSYQRNIDLLVTNYAWKVDQTVVGKDL